MSTVRAIRAGVISVCLGLTVLAHPFDVSGQQAARRSTDGIKVSKELALYVAVDQDSTDRLRLILRLRNISAGVVDVREWLDREKGPYWDYELIALDQNGKQIDKTVFGQLLAAEERGGSGTMRPLNPGEELVRTIDPEKILAFERPGRYYIRVIGFIHSLNATEKVLSNLVLVRIPE